MVFSARGRRCCALLIFLISYSFCIDLSRADDSRLFAQALTAATRQLEPEAKSPWISEAIRIDSLSFSALEQSEFDIELAEYGVLVGRPVNNLNPALSERSNTYKRKAYNGELLSRSGQKLGRYLIVAVRSSESEGLSGKIILNDGSEFKLDRLNREIELQRIDSSKRPGCGVTKAQSRQTGAKKTGSEGVDTAGQADLVSEQLNPSIDSSEQLEFAAASGETIDLMVAYTARARREQGGTEAMLAEIELAVASANQSLANSALLQQFRLVKTYELMEDAYGGDLIQDLYDITSSAGKWSEAHVIKERHGADMLALVTESSFYCGRGWLKTLLGSGGPYSVTNHSCLDNLTLAHELGHNLGLHHDHENASESGYFSYSHGHRFEANGTTYRTVMSYAPGIRIEHFSNPYIDYEGVPTGIVDYTDNAGTLLTTFSQIADLKSPGIGADQVWLPEGSWYNFGSELVLPDSEDVEADVYLYDLSIPFFGPDLALLSRVGVEQAILEGAIYEDVVAEDIDGAEFSTGLLLGGLGPQDVRIIRTRTDSFYKVGFPAETGSPAMLMLRSECLRNCNSDYLWFGQDYLELDSDSYFREGQSGSLPELSEWDLTVQWSADSEPVKQLNPNNSQSRISQGLPAVLIGVAEGAQYDGFDWGEVAALQLGTDPLPLEADKIYIVQTESGWFKVRLISSNSLVARLEYREILPASAAPTLDSVTVQPGNTALVQWSNIHPDAKWLLVLQKEGLDGEYSILRMLINFFGGIGTETTVTELQTNRWYCYKVTAVLPDQSLTSNERCVWNPGRRRGGKLQIQEAGY